MYENKLIKGIYISRYIASWIKSGGQIGYAARRLGQTNSFMNWLRTLVIDGEHLTEEEIWRIYNFAMNGKLELEDSAEKFINQN